MDLAPLPPERLRRRCDPADFEFETTAAVDPLETTIGQPRALRAVGFGIEIEAKGYNIFATGPIGTGKRSMIESHLREHAAGIPAPEDWLYLFDFRRGGRPMALTLPSGEGRTFVDRLRHLVEEAQRRIPGAFESETYQGRRQELVEEVDQQRQKVIDEMREFAAARELSLEITPGGLVTIPLIEGKPVSPREFSKLSAQLRQRFKDRIAEVEARMPAALNRIRQIEREGGRRIAELDREVALFTIGHLIDEIKQQYEAVERLGDWLDHLREDVIEHLGNFRSESPEKGAMPEPMASGLRRAREGFLARYEPNLLVSHEDSGGAPVVFETNPTYYNLFGRIEYEATFGALSTDHRHIKPGALHRANGGYLMLDALNVLTQPFVWTKLKETLRTGKIEIETIGSQLMLFPTATVEPEPIDLDVKVVLVGPARLHALLYMLDEDVRKLFKVKADFEVQMPWEETQAREYAAFIAHQVRGEGLLDFNRDAVARVVEQGSRVAGDQGKLSTRFLEVGDLVAEASHWARQAGEEIVGAAHVEKAIEEKVYRSSLNEDRIRELIANRTLMIDLSGERVGQVNGLSVATVGDYEFGRPVRITASTAFGKGEVVNIDRETELSGPVHDKGFLILAGFLQERYGAERPLPLRASLVFEQSYDEVEGDSASCAELSALLSSLADAPLRQGIAVTGSVNQHGQLQAIGGVNEKIEGFFEVCRQAGLSGDQGVVIPAANTRHLMLREEVVRAVREGSFNVWAASTVDEAIGVLTGLEAGQRDVDGSYPDNSIHGRVEKRLDHLVELARRFGFGDRSDSNRAAGGRDPRPA